MKREPVKLSPRDSRPESEAAAMFARANPKKAIAHSQALAMACAPLASQNKNKPTGYSGSGKGRLYRTLKNMPVAVNHSAPVQ